MRRKDGGFNAVVEKIVQREQETPAYNNAGMIDDFRLRGARAWRTRSVL